VASSRVFRACIGVAPQDLRNSGTTSSTTSISPISFVCAPIRAGGEAVLGAIRFAGSIRNPFYFDGWQARFLEIAGRADRRLVAQCALPAAKEAGTPFLGGAHFGPSDAMNRFVQKQLRKNSWDEGGFFRQAMSLAHQVIPTRTIATLPSWEGSELVTVATCGQAWSGHPAEQAARCRLQPPETTAARSGCGACFDRSLATAAPTRLVSRRYSRRLRS